MSDTHSSPDEYSGLFDTVQDYANSIIGSGTIVSADTASVVDEDLKDFIVIDSNEVILSQDSFSPTASMREVYFCYYSTILNFYLCAIN